MFDFDTVVSRKNTASMKWDRYRNQDVLPFWVADMDFKVAEPIQQALEDRVSHGIFGYTVEPDGLSDAIIDHLKNEYQWSVDPDWIVWLPGVVTGLALSCRAFCQDGGEVVVNPPIYHHFYDSHEAARQKLVKVPLCKRNNRWTYDMQAMEAAFSSNTQLLLMCSPHNPTGTVFTKDELNAVAVLCKKHNVIMVSDEIHCDLVFDQTAKHIPTAAACPSMADRTVTLMSASKTWNLAGLNCSFAIIPNAKLRHQFRQTSQSIVSPVPPLAYTASLAAYRDSREWRKALLDYLAGNFGYIQEQLGSIAKVEVEPIQATYLAWIDVTGLELENAQAYFELHGVGLSAGEQFGQAGYVRMNFACPRSMLEEGVKRMQGAIEALK